MADFATKTRRHRKETTSMAELSKRLTFLYSRVNSRSDPDIQALIARTKAAMVDVAEQNDPMAEWGDK
jgi:hypothetical protein